MGGAVYTFTIGGLRRELALFEVATGLRIAVLNIPGDTELTEGSARLPAEKLKGPDYEAIATAKARSIPPAHALALRTDEPYVVLRKAYKPYTGVMLFAETLSTGTGSTLKGMEAVVDKPAPAW